MTWSDEFKKWFTQTVLKWFGFIGLIAMVVPLAVLQGGWWMTFAQLVLPITAGLMLGIDIKNGYKGFKTKIDN